MSRRKHKKLPSEAFIATIHGISHEGRGIAAINKKTTFISNALPQEEVEFTYTAMNSRFAQGRTTKVLQASSQRVQPKCEYFTLCGGCSLQHMDATAQIQLKQNTLVEQLQHFAKIEAQELMPPMLGPLYGYRHKARLGVRYVTKKQSVLVGFREQQSRYLTNMYNCDVLHPSLGELISPLREMIANLSIYADIAQIEVARGDEQSALIFRVLETPTDADKLVLISFAKQYELMLFLHPNKPQKITKLWPEDENDLLQYSHPDFDISLSFYPTDFTQVNLAINRKMVVKAIELLQLNQDDNVLDLFCGLGNFTLPISKFCAHVTGIEGSEEMVARAKMNATLNARENVDFFCADLNEDLSASWVTKKYSKLLLDPARSGALEVLRFIPSWQPQLIVYISCNPATFARDAGELDKLGYSLQKVGVMDMFPQTNHVESMAIFVRNH